VPSATQNQDLGPSSVGYKKPIYPAMALRAQRRQKAGKAEMSFGIHESVVTAQNLPTLKPGNFEKPVGNPGKRDSRGGTLGQRGKPRLPLREEGHKKGRLPDTPVQ